MVPVVAVTDRERLPPRTSVRALCAAVTPGLLRRSLAVSAVVGGLLFAINSGGRVATEGLTFDLAVRGLLTMLIPFVVSLASAAAARLELTAALSAAGRGPACEVRSER